jgi:hypothetical protein
LHPCRQVQLLFEACQLGGKFEVVALYRKDVFLQIEDYLTSSRSAVFLIISLIFLRVLSGSSQRSQELDDGLLIIPLQFFKLLGYMVCFAAVPQDGVAKRQRCAIVHQARTQADAP